MAELMVTFCDELSWKRPVREIELQNSSLTMGLPIRGEGDRRGRGGGGGIGEGEGDEGEREDRYVHCNKHVSID